MLICQYKLKAKYISNFRTEFWLVGIYCAYNTKDPGSVYTFVFDYEDTAFVRWIPLPREGTKQGFGDGWGGKLEDQEDLQ